MNSSDPASRFAPGYLVRLRPETRRLDDGAVLVGGSPLRALRLSPSGRALVAGDVVDPGTHDGERLAARMLDGNLALPDLSGVAAVPATALTVVIPVRDRPEQLRRCLSSLRPLSCIVVDDASVRPAEVAAVAEEFGARLVALTTNAGPAAARNRGREAADTDLIAFVDSDVQVTSDTLLRLCRHFSDRRLALVAPRVDGATSGAKPGWIERYDAERSSLTLGGWSGVVAGGTRISWLPSACVIVRNDALGRGFDESMRVGEDVDLVWRLAHGGAVVRYDASEVAVHDARKRLSDWFGRKVAYGTGAGPLARRHGDRIAPAVLSPLGAGAGAAMLSGSRFAAPLALVALVVTASRVRAALPATRGRGRLSVTLAAQGLVQTLVQESALLLRHWWPAAVVGALFSRHVRRALLGALLVDTLSAIAEHRGVPSPSGLLARRIDDLGYGLGVWLGALRVRSPRALTIKWTK